MRALVLGAAAGGGFPQWNCNCRNCAGLRSGAIRAVPRTQSSLAVTVNEREWLLLNASPDIRTQLASRPELWPSDGKRGTRIRAILLADAQLDHTVGLLTLREGAPLDVYCTDEVRDCLEGKFPVFEILRSYCGVRRHPIPTNGDSFRIDGLDGMRLTAIPLPGRPPPYARTHQNGAEAKAHSIALAITDEASGRTLLYAPGLSHLDERIAAWLKESACALLDGTLWTDDELIVQGCGGKRGQDMGHVPLSGAKGLVQWVSSHASPQTRKILIHINNTNPILDEDSSERAMLAEAGVEVAYDGMEIIV